MTGEPDSRNSTARQIVTWGIGALAAIASFLAEQSFAELRKSVDHASERTEAAVQTLNTHSTRIELLDLRVTRTEQDGADHARRLADLERAAAAKRQQ